MLEGLLIALGCVTTAGAIIQARKGDMILSVLLGAVSVMLLTCGTYLLALRECLC